MVGFSDFPLQLKRIGLTPLPNIQQQLFCFLCGFTDYQRLDILHHSLTRCQLIKSSHLRRVLDQVLHQANAFHESSTFEQISCFLFLLLEMSFRFESYFPLTLLIYCKIFWKWLSFHFQLNLYPLNGVFYSFSQVLSFDFYPPSDSLSLFDIFSKCEEVS